MIAAFICWLIAFAFFANAAYQAGKSTGYKKGWRDCLETNGVEAE